MNLTSIYQDPINPIIKYHKEIFFFCILDRIFEHDQIIPYNISCFSFFELQYM